MNVFLALYNAMVLDYLAWYLNHFGLFLAHLPPKKLCFKEEEEEQNTFLEKVFFLVFFFFYDPSLQISVFI